MSPKAPENKGHVPGLLFRIPWPRHLLGQHELGWEELERRLDIRVSDEQLQHLPEELEATIFSLKVYADAAQWIAFLQSAGVKVGFCSNLASGYGPAVRELLPGLVSEGWLRGF